jgi:hypothetical protein
MCMCQIDVLEVDGEYYGGFLDPLIIGLLTRFGASGNRLHFTCRLVIWSVNLSCSEKVVFINMTFG